MSQTIVKDTWSPVKVKMEQAIFANHTVEINATGDLQIRNVGGVASQKIGLSFNPDGLTSQTFEAKGKTVGGYDCPWSTKNVYFKNNAGDYKFTKGDLSLNCILGDVWEDRGSYIGIRSAAFSSLNYWFGIGVVHSSGAGVTVSISGAFNVACVQPDNTVVSGTPSMTQAGAYYYYASNASQIVWQSPVSVTYTVTDSKGVHSFTKQRQGVAMQLPYSQEVDVSAGVTFGGAINFPLKASNGLQLSGTISFVGASNPPSFVGNFSVDVSVDSSKYTCSYSGKFDSPSGVFFNFYYGKDGNYMTIVVIDDSGNPPIPGESYSINEPTPASFQATGVNAPMLTIKLP